MTTEAATAHAPALGARSAEDLAEYQRRVANARTLMRRLGLDALVVSDNRPAEGLLNVSSPAYARYISGHRLTGGGAGYPNSRNAGPINAVVVLPLSGDPTLVVPSGIRFSHATVARAGSWIQKIVCTYLEDPAWEFRTSWGLASQELAADVAKAITDSGLERARIGVSGTWTGIEETKARFPHARFEPTVVKDATSGRSKDLLEPLIGANSPWEIKKLELAHAAADAVVKRFVDLARAGATIREAYVDAHGVGMRKGAEWINMVGSTSVEPWAWGAWPFGANPDASFERDKMYTLELARCAVEGYSVQVVRSFVIGSANKAQAALIEASTHAHQAMLARVEPGVTGDQLFAAGMGSIKKTVLEPWSRFGHSAGFEFDGPQRIQFMPGNAFALLEGQVVVVHPALFDKATGYAGEVGGTVLVEKNGWRYLSPGRPYYELTG